MNYLSLLLCTFSVFYYMLSLSSCVIEIYTAIITLDAIVNLEKFVLRYPVFLEGFSRVLYFLGIFFNVYYAVPTLNSSLSELFVTNITLACFKTKKLYHIFLEGQSHILQFSVISSRCLFMCLHLLPPYVNCFSQI